MYYCDLPISGYEEHLLAIDKAVLFFIRESVVPETDGLVRKSEVAIMPVTETLYRRATDEEAKEFICECDKLIIYQSECPHQYCGIPICMHNYPSGTVDARDGSRLLIPVNKLSLSPQA